MKDKLRELLSPHFGHLDFLMKIHKEEISFDDMSLLVDLIKEKNLVSNLSKDLHSYSSYYFLMIELHFVKENLKYLKFFKEITKEPREIFLNILKSDAKFKRIKSKIDRIMVNDELTSSFRRWSSRIKDEEYAITYVNLLNDADSLDKIFNSDGVLTELKDYDESIGSLPISWCITNRDTFYQYLRTQKIYLGAIDGVIYGINVATYNNQISSIIDNNNRNVYDPSIMLKFSELLNATLLDSGGRNTVQITIPKSESRNIFKRVFDIF